MNLTKGDLLCKGKGGMSTNKSVGVSSAAATPKQQNLYRLCYFLYII